MGILFKLTSKNIRQKKLRIYIASEFVSFVRGPVPTRHAIHESWLRLFIRGCVHLIPCSSVCDLCKRRKIGVTCNTVLLSLIDRLKKETHLIFCQFFTRVFEADACSIFARSAVGVTLRTNWRLARVYCQCKEQRVLKQSTNMVRIIRSC